jgi:hypothetical protein
MILPRLNCGSMKPDNSVEIIIDLRHGTATWASANGGGGPMWPCFAAWEPGRAVAADSLYQHIGPGHEKMSGTARPTSGISHPTHHAWVSGRAACGLPTIKMFFGQGTGNLSKKSQDAS